MRTLTIALTLASMLVLVACGGSAPEAPAVGTEDPTSGLDTLNPEANPALLQLIMGTFKLEGTGLAVDAEQAAELVPLWQAYSALSRSETSAPEEMAAVAAQIEETMSSAQFKAIAALQFTASDIASVIQEAGIELGDRGEGRRPGGTDGDQPGQGRPGGGFPGGVPGQGPGGGGQGYPGGVLGDGGQELSPEQLATMEAFREQRANQGANPILVQALIELLQSKFR